MDMDSQWRPPFLQAHLKSKVASCLPIWRVFKTDASGAREAISDEGARDETWNAVMAYR
jgi:hypothetical protein